MNLLLHVSDIASITFWPANSNQLTLKFHRPAGAMEIITIFGLPYSLASSIYSAAASHAPHELIAQPTAGALTSPKENPTHD